MADWNRKQRKGMEWRHVENKKLVYTVYFVLRLSVVLIEQAGLELTKICLPLPPKSWN